MSVEALLNRMLSDFWSANQDVKETEITTIRKRIESRIKRAQETQEAPDATETEAETTVRGMVQTGTETPQGTENRGTQGRGPEKNTGASRERTRARGDGSQRGNTVNRT